MAANLTAALQNVTQQIDNLGAGKGVVAISRPSPALSRVTDTVVGTSVHDFHKLRPAGVPAAIPENALLDAASKASAETKASKTKYIVGIVIVVALIIAVMVALYFLRKRTEERERQEKEEATKRVTLQDDEDDEGADDDDDKTAFPSRMMSPPPPLPVPQRAVPPPMPSASVPVAQPQPPAGEMEAAVARALETKKRLEALKQNLDKGISNVVTNVSETVAQTIVAEKTFQAHAATQEHDEKVLLNQGTPALAAAPLDKDVSVIADAAVLDEPTDAHPTNDTPAGGALPEADSTA